MRVYIGIGSNLGNRHSNLSEAIRRIKALGLKITKVSSIYETEPVGFRDQPWFLNQVVEAEFKDAVTERDADTLLDSLLEIEREMGRERMISDGPRTIDIDLLLCGDSVIHPSSAEDGSQAHLIIPHPRMHLRRFVLEPLCEIAPDAAHPVFNKTCRQLLDELEDPSIVRLDSSGDLS